MRQDLSKIPVSSMIGLIIILFFCLALVLAIINYPPGFTPIKNWMSDLGNPELNPAGSIYFNVGCVITGLLLATFYISLLRWQDMDSRKAKIFSAARALGVFSGIALAGVGVFNETYDPHHFIVSVLFFVSSCIAILLVTLALQGSPGFDSITAWAGYLAVAVGVVFAVQRPMVPSIKIIEWLSVFSMLLWAALLGINMYRVSCGKTSERSIPAGSRHKNRL